IIGLELGNMCITPFDAKPELVFRGGDGNRISVGHGGQRKKSGLEESERRLRGLIPRVRTGVPALISTFSIDLPAIHNPLSGHSRRVSLSSRLRQPSAYNSIAMAPTFHDRPRFPRGFSCASRNC